jgi:RimJ/RimL family protein N-acetyltransferase
VGGRIVTIELRGPTVTLRAFRPEEYDEMIARFSGTPADEEEARMRRTRVERSGTRTEIELLFAVESDGRLVGDTQARSLRMAMPFGVWEIGIELWETRDRGRGLGREAVALLTSRLFEREGAHRVQGSTDVENAAMRHVFEALGFTDEGTMRGFMPTGDGAPRDYELYGVTATDWMRND